MPLTTLRKLLLHLWLLLATSVVVIVTTLRPSAAWSIARWWARGVLRVAGARCRIEGRDQSLGEGPFVILCNHRSYMDTPLLIAHLPIFFGFIVKQELMRIPIFRGAMRAIGCVAVSRRGSRKDHAVLDSVAVEVKGGKNVLLFPEGSRSPTDEFLPFKKGGVVLAIKAQVPILPVAVSGTNRVLSADRSTLRPGPLLLRIGSPISTTGLGLEDRERLLDEVQAAIVGLYQPAYTGDTPEEVLCESATMS